MHKLAVPGLLACAAATASLATAARSPDLVRRTVPGYGVSVEAPASWHAVAVPAQFASSGIVYVIRDSSQPAASFRNNLNLIVTTLPTGESLRQWMFSGSSAPLAYVGETTTVTIGGVQGLHYSSTKAQKVGSIPLLTDQYAFVRGGRVFLFTYTSLASAKAAAEPVFAASAQTIEFT